MNLICRLMPGSVILLMTCLSSPTTVAASKPPPPPPSQLPKQVELQDQFGTRHRLEFPRSTPLILLVADRRGSEDIDGWVQNLASQPWHGSAEIVGVADVHGIPRMFRGRVSASIEKSQPKNPVLLDFEGVVIEALDCERHVVNVFLVDPQGQARLRITGPAQAEKSDQLRAALKNLGAAPSSQASAPPSQDSATSP